MINSSDYTLIDNAFNAQEAVISASIASLSAVIAAPIAPRSAAVPEPAALALLSSAVTGTLGRRQNER